MPDMPVDAVLDKSVVLLDLQTIRIQPAQSQLPDCAYRDPNYEQGQARTLIGPRLKCIR